MKLFILLAFLFTLFLVPCFAQQSENSAVNNNLYYRALSATLDKFDKSLGDDIVVEKDEITGDLPSQIGKKRIEYLNYEGLRDKYKKLKKEFPILRAHPLKIDGNSLTISFTKHYFKYKKRVFHFAISDWTEVFFSFNCEKQEFVLDKIELGGI